MAAPRACPSTTRAGIAGNTPTSSSRTTGASGSLPARPEGVEQGGRACTPPCGCVMLAFTQGGVDLGGEEAAHVSDHGGGRRDPARVSEDGHAVGTGGEAPALPDARRTPTLSRGGHPHAGHRTGSVERRRRAVVLISVFFARFVRFRPRREPR